MWTSFLVDWARIGDHAFGEGNDPSIVTKPRVRQDRIIRKVEGIHFDPIPVLEACWRTHDET